MTERPHGTRAKYVREKCHCDPCKAANRAAENDRYRQQAYGRWQPYVDARPVRAHVLHLMESGLGWKRAAELAGVSRGVVEKLLYGSPARGDEPTKGIRPQNAEKLLAVQPLPGLVSSSVLVDATGTRRRVQALVAAGWSVAQLAQRLGRERTNFWVTVSKARVELGTEREVQKLYDQLWRADPLAHGVAPNAVSRARNLAKARGWAPVGAWDDDTIDNPAAHPDWTGHCGTARGYHTHYDHGIKPVCEPCRAAKAASRHPKKHAA